MALATTAALDAFAGVIALSGLPAPRRNDLRLQDFDEAGRLFAMADGDIVQQDAELGEGPGYELDQQCEILLAVQGEPGPERDARLTDMFEAVAIALFPEGVPLSVINGFDDISIVGPVQRDRQLRENAAPIEYLIFTVALTLTASTPLG